MSKTPPSSKPAKKSAKPAHRQFSGPMLDGPDRLHLEHGHPLQHAHRPPGPRRRRPGSTPPAARRSIFNTITISDGISMGTEGMKYSLVSREVIADSIETVTGCQGFDGVVAIGGCDKNMPGCLMAIARLNRPGIFVYGGTILPGCTAANRWTSSRSSRRSAQTRPARSTTPS
jgi:hypothetical protein